MKEVVHLPHTVDVTSAGEWVGVEWTHGILLEAWRPQVTLDFDRLLTGSRNRICLDSEMTSSCGEDES